MIITWNPLTEHRRPPAKQEPSIPACLLRPALLSLERSTRADSNQSCLFRAQGLGYGYGDHMSQIVFNSKMTVLLSLPGRFFFFLVEGVVLENIVPEIHGIFPFTIRVILGLTQGLGAPWHGLEVPGWAIFPGSALPRREVQGWGGPVPGGLGALPVICRKR